MIRAPVPKYYNPPKQGPLLPGMTRKQFNEINPFVF